jgi:heme-degrading monooxygenase HmoA
MAITRVFRVRIDAALRREFEEKFADISVRAVKEAPGSLAVAILKPTIWTPDEYAMVSQWKDEESLRAFAGEQWNRAVIPNGMEKFVRECWVHHYEAWDSA